MELRLQKECSNILIESCDACWMSLTVEDEIFWLKVNPVFIYRVSDSSFKAYQRQLLDSASVI